MTPLVQYPVGPFVLWFIVIIGGFGLYFYLKARRKRLAEEAERRARLAQHGAVAGQPGAQVRSTATPGSTAPRSATPQPAPSRPNSGPGRPPAVTYTLGQGRKFTSSVSVEQLRDTLEVAISSYRQVPYSTMTHLSYPRFVWAGTGPAPEVVAAFDGVDNSPRFVPIWRTDHGSEAGMFNLTQEMQMPEVGIWSTAGASITSVGTIPASLLRIGAPEISADYMPGILRAASYPGTAANIAVVEQQVRQMLLVKAWQYMTGNGKHSQYEAEQFSQTWGPASGQQILDALAAWDTDVIPYLPDLPDRIRGIILDGDHSEGIWADLDQAAPTLLPPEILSQLADFGQVAWDARMTSRPVTDPRFDWNNFLGKVADAVAISFDRVVAELHTAAGDDPLARYGAYRILAEFEPTSTNPRYGELLDAALQMMFDARASSGHLTGYESSRWIATHGDLRTSFDRLVAVDVPVDLASGIDLNDGERLKLAKLGPDPLDNEFWLERAGSSYLVFSMRKPTSDDTVLRRYEEPQIPPSDTADLSLRRLGQTLSRKPYWAEPRLVPFFPERRES